MNRRARLPVLSHLAPGQYTATRTAVPRSGTTIVGRKPWGKDVTRIVASSEWNLVEKPDEQNPDDEYLIAFQNAKDIHIHSLALESLPAHRITGAIRCARSEDVHIHDCVIKEFRWSGIHLEHSAKLDIHVLNNTIFCADAGNRSGALLSSYTAERLNNWVFKNNLVIAAWTRPRPVFSTQRGVPTKITATHNLCINMLDVPNGNHVELEPGLMRTGEKPSPFFVPRSSNSFVVDKGVDVGLPCEGSAPDIGAFEFDNPWTLEGIPTK